LVQDKSTGALSIRTYANQDPVVGHRDGICSRRFVGRQSSADIFAENGNCTSL